MTCTCVYFEQRYLSITNLLDTLGVTTAEQDFSLREAYDERTRCRWTRKWEIVVVPVHVWRPMVPRCLLHSALVEIWFAVEKSCKMFRLLQDFQFPPKSHPYFLQFPWRTGCFSSAKHHESPGQNLSTVSLNPEIVLCSTIFCMVVRNVKISGRERESAKRDKRLHQDLRSTRHQKHKSDIDTTRIYSSLRDLSLSPRYPSSPPVRGLLPSQSTIQLTPW